MVFFFLILVIIVGEVVEVVSCPVNLSGNTYLGYIYLSLSPRERERGDS